MFLNLYIILETKRGQIWKIKSINIIKSYSGTILLLLVIIISYTWKIYRKANNDASHDPTS